MCRLAFGNNFALYAGKNSLRQPTLSGSFEKVVNVEENLEKVLAAREERWKKRRAFVKNHRICLITVTLCVPYKYRISDEFRSILTELCKKFYKELKSNFNDVKYEGHMQNDDGSAVFISSCQDARKIKRACVDAESSTIGGRIMDIDVMDSDGHPVNRSNIGLPPRKCFICGKPASVCTSRRLHSREEIYSYVEKLKTEIENTLN